MPGGGDDSHFFLTSETGILSQVGVVVVVVAGITGCRDGDAFVGLDCVGCIV